MDFIDTVAVLLFFLIILGLILGVSEEKFVPFNTTETVVYKDIGHVHEFLSDNNQYNVYTNNHSYKVSLEDYNSISIGDNLTVEYDTGTFLPILYYNDKEYFASWNLLILI